MGDRKRNKPGSSGPEKEGKINWSKEYFKLLEANEKIYEKLNEEKELRIKEARNMPMLKWELGQANTDLLRIKKKMSPCGAIEFFEARGLSLSLNVIKLSRGDKWKFYYQKDYKGFKTEMQLKFPNLISMTLVQQENFVVDLVMQTYSNTSCFHHSFDLREAVFICPSDYPQDQMSFLKIVCKCLPCWYKTV